MEEGNQQSWHVRGLPAEWYLWKTCLQIIQRVGTLLPLNWCPHWKYWEVLDVVVAVVVDTENVVGDKEDDGEVGENCGGIVTPGWAWGAIST